VKHGLDFYSLPFRKRPGGKDLNAPPLLKSFDAFHTDLFADVNGIGRVRGFERQPGVNFNYVASPEKWLFGKASRTVTVFHQPPNPSHPAIGNPFARLDIENFFGLDPSDSTDILLKLPVKISRSLFGQQRLAIKPVHMGFVRCRHLLTFLPLFEISEFFCLPASAG